LRLGYEIGAAESGPRWRLNIVWVPTTETTCLKVETGADGRDGRAMAVEDGRRRQ
jgi:hypothetical protein